MKPYFIVIVCLTVFLVPGIHAQGIPRPGAPAGVPPVEKTKEDLEIERLTKARTKIAAENALRMEKLKQSMAKLIEEKQKL